MRATAPPFQLTWVAISCAIMIHAIEREAYLARIGDVPRYAEKWMAERDIELKFAK